MPPWYIVFVPIFTKLYNYSTKLLSDYSASIEDLWLEVNGTKYIREKQCQV